MGKGCSQGLILVPCGGEKGPELGLGCPRAMQGLCQQPPMGTPQELRGDKKQELAGSGGWERALKGLCLSPALLWMPSASKISLYGSITSDN